MSMLALGGIIVCSGKEREFIRVGSLSEIHVSKVSSLLPIRAFVLPQIANLLPKLQISNIPSMIVSKGLIWLRAQCVESCGEK